MGFMDIGRLPQVPVPFIDARRVSSHPLHSCPNTTPQTGKTTGFWQRAKVRGQRQAYRQKPHNPATLPQDCLPGRTDPPEEYM